MILMIHIGHSLLTENAEPPPDLFHKHTPCCTGESLLAGFRSISDSFSFFSFFIVG